MGTVDMIDGLLAGITRDEIDRTPPAHRRRLAQSCAAPSICSKGRRPNHPKKDCCANSATTEAPTDTPELSRREDSHEAQGERPEASRH